jgi:hypothetical protein
MKYPLQSPRLYADFNGFFGDLLCLSHNAVCNDENGAEVALRSGIIVTAYDDDTNDEGRRDNLIATGVVAPSPEYMSCRGSRWVLRIDENGVRHESDLLKNSL